MMNMCLRMLCQLLMMLTFCFLLVPAMRNANNRNANLPVPYNSDGRINGSGYERYNSEDMKDLNNGHDDAEPSTSNWQNVWSSEPEATSSGNSQMPPATLHNQSPKNLEDENIKKAIKESLKGRQTKRNNGPKNDSADENIQKVIEKSLEEYQTKLKNDKIAEAKLKKVIEQSAHEADLRRIAEAPARNEITTQQETLNESDGLDDQEDEALEELLKGNEEVLSKLNEKSRLKVLNVAEKLGVEASAVGQQQAPARNKITTQQETLNESDGLDDQENEALEALLNGNEKVLSKLNEKSWLKVLNVAEKIGVEASAVGQQPPWENENQETPNESDGLDDLEEEAVEELGNEEVLSEVNEKSRLKVRNVAKKHGVKESSTSAVGRQTKGAPAKVSPNSNERRSRKKSLPTRGWDDKANQYYADLSKKSTAQQGDTLSAKKTSKEERNMLAPGDQLRQMSIDELKELERRVKEKLEKEKVNKKAAKGNAGMPPASYDNMSQIDIDRRLAKLKERSNHRVPGMHSATAQSKKGREQKLKKGHFEKNLSELSTDSS